MTKRALLMRENDDVATVLDYICTGDSVQILMDGKSHNEIKVIDEIDCYHKIAVRKIKKGEEVFKYGEIIGRATQDISIGEHVHINNLESVMVV
ncbi:hypothetical protein SRRS_38270 [Sporomusa rhizae]|uniref:UxaA family hydrolase n=1 Tax=Sporomusa rhizae TaxID=357999 RepID=UPI00352B8DF3